VSLDNMFTWCGFYSYSKAKRQAFCSCSPDVEFCGYSIPHPAENKINFRIQTRGDAITLGN